MNEILSASVFIGPFLTLAAYVLAIEIRKKLRFGLFNQLLVAIIICIAVLVLLDIDYETYNQGARHINVLLPLQYLAWRIPWTEEPVRLYTVQGLVKSQTRLSK